MGYGPPGYGPPPPPPPEYGYGYGSGQPPASQGSAIGALIANIVGFCFCMLSLVGVVLAIIALTQHQTNPESARTLTIFAWLCFAVSVIVGLVFFFIYGWAIYYDFLVNDYDSYY